MARNDRRFRVTRGPAIIDPVREEVYQRYLTVARGRRAATLHDFRFSGADATVDAFDTQEICMWNGDELAAFCWFDLGDDSVQSLLGAYDPRFAKHGLGFHSLLLEIRLALETGRRFHYSVYVLPGDPSMDYKLAVGDVEYLDPARALWRPFPELDAGNLAGTRIERALARARTCLAQEGVACDLHDNPRHDLPDIHPKLKRALQQPLYLRLAPDPERRGTLVVEWNPESERYHLTRCSPAQLRLRRPGVGGEETSRIWWRVEELAAPPTADALAAFFQRRPGDP